LEDDPDLAAGWGGCQAVETEVDVNKIAISAGSVRVEAELNESATAQQVWEALPIDGRANTWGDEIYFEIPVTAEQAPDARAEVEVG